MNLTVRLPFRAIEEMLNRTFGEILHEGKAHNPGGLITYVKVTKQDRIKIYGQKNKIKTIIPVRVRVSMRKTDPLIISIIKDLSKVEKTSFDILVSFQTHLSIDENGHLTSTTESQFEWVTKPKVGIGLVKFKVSELVKPSLEKELLALTKEIDENIHEQVNLAWYANLALDELEKPLESDPEVPTWLILNPKSKPILVEEIIFEPSGLALPVSFHLAPIAYIGFEENNYSNISIELPPIEKLAEIPHSFHIPLTSEISYAFLNKELSGQEIEDAKNHISYLIQTVLFSKKEDKIAVISSFETRINRRFFKAKINGEASISAKTHYDEKGKRLELRDFSLSIDKLPFWARIYVGLNKSSIDKQVKQSLEQAIQEQLQMVTEEISGILADYPIDRNLRLKTDLEALIPTLAVPKEDRLVVNLNLSGRMELLIENIEELKEEIVEELE